MDITAKSKHLRHSAKKMRFVLKSVKGLSANDAISKLSFINKKAAIFINKTIKSAISNYADQNIDGDTNNLYIKEAFVDEGPTAKRFRPAAMGRATPILKRTSHLTVVLSDTKDKRS
tara:strand:- start:708 stop:1058 length:351 start_codon:yes stop_codon:yes gene_type:complete